MPAKSPQRRVFVVGVGMTNFVKPKSKPGEGPQWTDLGVEAIKRALADACVTPKEIETVACGSMFTLGAAQRIAYAAGIFGVPMMTVNNACATGSNALFIARNAVAAGQIECGLAVGVEKMKPGSLGGDGGSGGGPREPTSLDVHYHIMNESAGFAKVPPMPQFFGNAGREYMKLYPGCQPKHFAMIGEKSHRHSVNNPYSQFRDPATLEQVQNSPMIYEPLTKLQCSPTSDGAACVIVASEDFVRKHGLEGQAVEILAMSMRTDEPISFKLKNIKENPRAMINLIGYPMAEAAAKEVYAVAGIKPSDVNVVELHDCFSANELITYEALGLCEPGEAWKMVERGDNTYGGKVVVNPSGGLISKGHPLGATGCAMCCELTWQLRGEAGPRQVKDARVALQHNLGLGGAVVVAAYRKPEEWKGKAPKRAVSGALGFPGAKL